MNHSANTALVLLIGCTVCNKLQGITAVIWPCRQTSQRVARKRATVWSCFIFASLVIGFNTRSHADLLSKQVSNEKDHVILILYVVCQLLEAAHGVRA